MQKDLTLVLDLGSHACRVALFTPLGDLQHLASTELSTHSPASGFYEQDAPEILQAFTQLLAELPVELLQRTARCGICTQRSSIVAWHRHTGEVLSPVISWRDRRNQAMTDSLLHYGELVRHITGLTLSPHYSASKMCYLLEHNPLVRLAAEQQQLCLAPLASYLLFHLLDQPGYVIDHSNAQRTLLFNIHTLNWSLPLLALFDIDAGILPACKPVIYPYGKLKQSGIPVTAVCGDQNAVYHAYPQSAEASGLINIGTGAFMLCPDQGKTEHELLCTIASSHGERADTLREGTVNGAGAAISWAQQRYPQPSLFQHLPDWLIQVQHPPLFINTVSGLGSPWWCDGGDCEFIGEENNSVEEKYVAIIESIVFLLYANIQRLSPAPQQFFISGGLSRLDALCQKLADLCGHKIIRYDALEASALGCAYLANQLTPEYDFQPAARLDCEFIPVHNRALKNRYRQFVGELKKRCNSV